MTLDCSIKKTSVRVKKSKINELKLRQYQIGIVFYCLLMLKVAFSRHNLLLLNRKRKVGSERYNFSNEMKIKAHKRAELFNPQEPKDVHHIFPKSLAKKYNLPTFLVKTDDNAIALERDFHSWIHGNRLTTKQLAGLLGDEMTEWDYNHSDCEIEWKSLYMELIPYRYIMMIIFF